ncbi:MGMT family protein [Lactococcus formosensis]|jgi:methylated-DNA-protein-cysteine methyltransferase-like protein|uniref:MGMT family protein n=1 Tax=Lactococcus formosensis TaxID=1281486 RepID=A0A9Q9D711_9LACT|nr:MGMT family protein [Lactococcus formosensis]MDT2725683.1 MGMT family protein [Lactococcus formosensis]USJ20783.1 MGMT family protein [Lactococcus formosensis]
MVKEFADLKPETQRILQEIKAVPYGQVSSYRDIALRAGLINGARQVARVLHGLSERHLLPWWRIIRSDGTIGLHGEGRLEQIRLLKLEGVEVSDKGKVRPKEKYFKGV